MKPCRNTDILCHKTSLATSPIRGDYRCMVKQFRLSDQSIVGFVATSDPDRAKKFFRDTLGLRLVSEEMPFALVFDAHGTMLRVTIVKEVIAAGYTILGWQVPDIVAAAKALSKAGVRFERYQGMSKMNSESGRHLGAPGWRGSKTLTAIR